MLTNDLMSTASQLKAPSEASLKEFSEKREALAVAITDRLLARHDIDRLVGPENQEMARTNGRNFPRFMTALMGQYNPQVLVNTCVWAMKTYQAHGFLPAYWPAHLDLWVETLGRELSPKAAAEIVPFFSWILVNIPLLSVQGAFEQDPPF